MSAREILLQEIECLPEPLIEETLLYVRFAARQRENPSWLQGGAVPAKPAAVDPLSHHADLKGRILYDPTEPATEADWPTSAR